MPSFMKGTCLNQIQTPIKIRKKSSLTLISTFAGFDNRKVAELTMCLSEEERKEFEFDVSSIVWKDCIISRVNYSL